jgi:hypothetical protein
MDLEQKRADFSSVKGFLPKSQCALLGLPVLIIGPEGRGASPPISPPPRAILPAITSTCNISEAHLLPSYHILLLIIVYTDADLLIV